MEGIANMQISTTARHCELDAEVRTYALQRLAKLERFARDIQEAHLVVTAEKFRHRAEITLRLKHHEMVSREESDTSKTAIDLAAGRLEQQLRRLKEKRTEHKRSARGVAERAGANGEREPAAEEPDVETGTED
jgi:putative sigma-54 modulation protein